MNRNDSVLRRRLYSSWALLLFATAMLSGQTVPPGGQWAARSSFAPFYTTENFQARLALSNAGDSAINVTPILYSLSGDEYDLPAVSVGPHLTRNVELSNLPLGFEKGSLRVDYVGPLNTIRIAVLMTNTADSLELDLFAQPQSLYPSARLEALWWAPFRGTTFVAVSNTTGVQVRANLSITSADGAELRSQDVPLAPHATRVINLSEAVSRSADPVGGVSITHDGRGGAVMAQMFSYAADHRFSAFAAAVDPLMSGTNTLSGAGVILKTPGGERLLDGHLLLRNTGDSVVGVTAKLQQGTYEYALPAATLPPHSARDITVSAATVPDPSTPTGIRIDSSGPPTDLIAAWYTMDSSGDLVVQTPLRSPGRTDSRGGNHPWNLSGDNVSTFYLKNTGDTSGTFLLRLWHPGGDYLMGLQRVEAGQTFALDIRKLRDDQVPDQNGHTIPPDAEVGHVAWRWRSGPLMVGRVNTSSASTGISISMSCPTCGCPCPVTSSMYLSPGSWSGSVGSSFGSTIWRLDYNPGSCTPDQPYSFPSDWAYWWSSNPSVAIVDYGFVSAVGPGSTWINSSIDVENLDRDPFYEFQGYPDECWGCIVVAAGIAASQSETVKPIVAFNSQELSVFMGDDATVTARNAQSALGSPSGGAYSWTSADPSVSFHPPSSALSHLEAHGSPGDASITITYSANNQSASASRTVHKRLFVALEQYGQVLIIQYSPPNESGYREGYVATVKYFVITAPNQQRIEPGIGQGIAVYENVTDLGSTVNGQPVNIPTQDSYGNGTLDENSQASDNLGMRCIGTTQYCIPPGYQNQKRQEFVVGNFFVRRNLVSRTETAVSITIEAPLP